jgi:hypothetical protein
MDADELKRFVPYLLEGRYPGRSQPVVGDGGDLGWTLDLDDTIVYVRASSGSNPFIWIRGGIAHAVPRSEALALHVAAANKDLVVGRVYMGYGDDLAMVVFDEAIFSDYLSNDYMPSMQDLVTRLETSLEYTAQWSKEIREKFGGRPFAAGDWMLMAF